MLTLLRKPQGVQYDYDVIQNGAEKRQTVDEKISKKVSLENIGYSHINKNTFVIPIDLLLIFVVVISICNHECN